MGAFVSKEIWARLRSERIDKKIEEESHTFRKECKILLLGSPESGKSTIMKQVKINYQNGYTSEELSAFRLVIYKNLIDSAKDIVLAMEKIGVDFVENINRGYAADILAYQVDPVAFFRLSPGIVIAIESFWKDPIITTVMDHSSKFYLMDSAPYFFSHVRRIGAGDYIPNQSDVLRARDKTTAGISETRFDLSQFSIHMVEVSSQRFERQKWIHCFKSVTSIIFCVALSEYDQVLQENKEQNKIAGSLVLFESAVNSRWFSRTSIILLLNKIDLFKAKLPKAPLERYFLGYTGGPDINKATKYILWKFAQANRSRLSVYVHLTEATAQDGSFIRLVSAGLRETILSKRSSGLWDHIVMNKWELCFPMKYPTL
ncbi:Guanine nucleotide-binding protein alpha-2 subunit [Tulasnella sp. JGI-2019a]|nr:Guanine nucleotide-binding protein alpha-2 subunit [Tulasnella sp. JGI-2019a]KAG9003149.1 Guanine nucleotide-binding protein alpha-2 subunit [Tulasnella sp. JGI-2019a]